MKRVLPILLTVFAVLLLNTTDGESSEPDEQQYCLSRTEPSHYAIKGKCSTSYETNAYAIALREWIALKTT